MWVVKIDHEQCDFYQPKLVAVFRTELELNQFFLNPELLIKADIISTSYDSDVYYTIDPISYADLIIEQWDGVERLKSAKTEMIEIRNQMEDDDNWSYEVTIDEFSKLINRNYQ